MSARASGADTKANGDASYRSHNDGGAKRPYTAEQKTAVIRVRKCSPTAFYDILALEEVRATATDSDIKKAYRKLSLLTHPDKNGYEGADEAFKKVSRAFQVLSDPDKKTKFDKFGGDPDSRFGASTSTSSPFSNFARSSNAGAAGGSSMFEEEISPEELFRQFFGGAMGGGGGGLFGGPMGGAGFDSPGFVFNLGGFGGPGVRIHQFGGPTPRRRPATHGQPNDTSLISSLLPLLILFVLPLLSSLFGSGSDWSSSGPSVRFSGPVPPHTQLRTSNRLGVSYYVDPVVVRDYSYRQWRDLDRSAESRYVGQLSRECEDQSLLRERLYREAQGWFSVDAEKERQARAVDMSSCRRLRDLGLSR